jgi:hypothetical protein
MVDQEAGPRDRADARLPAWQHDTPAGYRDIDPADRLVWRHAPRRLEAEEIRDSILQSSGQLNLDHPQGSPSMALRVIEMRDDGPVVHSILSSRRSQSTTEASICLSCAVRFHGRWQRSIQSRKRLSRDSAMKRLCLRRRCSCSTRPLFANSLEAGKRCFRSQAGATIRSVFDRHISECLDAIRHRRRSES